MRTFITATWIPYENVYHSYFYSSDATVAFWNLYNYSRNKMLTQNQFNIESIL